MSRSLNAANLLLLTGICLMPWVTSNLAEGLGSHEPDAGREALVLYVAAAVFGAIAFVLFFHVLARDPALLHDPAHARAFAADRFVSLAGIAATLCAAAVGWRWSPLAGTIILALLTVVYVVAPDGFDRTARETPSENQAP